MSNAAINWSLQQETGSPAKKLLLFVIADLADEEHTCWPSIEYLTEKVEVSKRSLITYLNELEADGHLRRERRSDGFGGRKSNRYRLPVDEPFEQKSAESPLSANSAPSEPNCISPQSANLAPSAKTPGQQLSANLAPCDGSCSPQGANCCTYIETPQEKEDKSSFIENDPHGSFEDAQRPKEKLFDDGVDEALAVIHPSLTVAAIASKLKVADIHELDVLYATQTILGRATQTVRFPVSFVARAIDKSPDAWRPVLPGFEPGDDVSGVKSRRAIEVESKAACARGDHDWGPSSWAEIDRKYCVRPTCNTSRRSVDQQFAVFEDAQDLTGGDL